MASLSEIRLHKLRQPAPISANPDCIARQARVEHLRQLVARGAYKVNSHRLALRILTKALCQTE
jgi:anti-sigma28 factor (negative regulator of flagellin synthesis)